MDAVAHTYVRATKHAEITEGPQRRLRGRLAVLICAHNHPSRTEKALARGVLGRLASKRNLAARREEARRTRVVMAAAGVLAEDFVGNVIINGLRKAKRFIRYDFVIYAFSPSDMPGTRYVIL